MPGKDDRIPQVRQAAVGGGADLTAHLRALRNAIGAGAPSVRGWRCALRAADNRRVVRPLLFGLLVFALLGAASWWLLQKVRGGRGGPEEAAAVAAALRAPNPAAPSDAPVELVLPRGIEWTGVGWGAVCALIGLALFADPGPLRSAWIAVPAGVVLLLVAALLVWFGWPVPDGRLVVSPAGVRQELAAGTQSIDWSRVSEFAIVTERNRYRPGTQQTTWLVVTDPDGREFLRETVPLGPPDAWQRLLDSVPAWSGRRIVHRSR